MKTRRNMVHLLMVLSMVLSLSTIAGFAHAQPSNESEPSDPPQPQAACTLKINKTASPAEVDAGGIATIKLTLESEGDCSTTSPVDVVLVLDRSGSMSGSSMTNAKTAAVSFVNQMNLTSDPADQVGVASFSSRGNVRLDSQLSQNKTTVTNAINRIYAGGMTDMTQGLEIAETELGTTRHKQASGPAIILLSDGYQNDWPLAKLYAVSDHIKAAGIRVISIGLGQANEAQLKRVASSDKDYYYTPRSSDLSAIYQDIAGRMRWAARQSVVVDTLVSDNVTLVPNSFTGPVQATVSGNKITWNVGTVNTAETVELTYQVVMRDDPGTWATNESATVSYIDTDGTNANGTFPVPSVTVKEDCGQPTANSITENWVCANDTSESVTIAGGGFFADTAPIVEIGGSALSVQSTQPQAINATYTGGLSAGVYDVKVTNQCQAQPLSSTIKSAFTVLPAPQVLSVRPPEGYGDLPNDITICGEGFGPGAVVQMSNTTTQTALLNQQVYGDNCVIGTVPKDLPAGEYTLTVTGPCGSATGTYRVLSPELNDDLWGSDLWVDPAMCMRMTDDIQIGLTVNRRGGKAPLQPVVVRFYEDTIDEAHKIGDGQIALMPPRAGADPSSRIAGYSTSAVPWVPSSGVMSYTIYAVIDPDNKVTEDVENNNIVKREVQVLPGDETVDGVAPRVETFKFNNNDTVYDKDVTVVTTAKDYAQQNVTPVGVKDMNVVELIYSQAANVWVPVRSTGWLSYTNNFDYSLFAHGGVRYVQTWVSDKNGNVSRYPYQQQINYTGDDALNCTHIQRDATQTYRRDLDVGDTLSVEMGVCEGDPDLYIWPPDYADGSPAYVSNLEGDREEFLSIEATVKGTYTVEVYGYNKSEYKILMETGPMTPTNGVSSTLQMMAPSPYTTAGISNKPQPSAPVLPPDSKPSITMGVAPAPYDDVVPPKEPVVDGAETGTITATNGMPVIGGTAEPNSTVELTIDLSSSQSVASGLSTSQSVVYETTANGDGKWEIDLANDAPVSGTVPNGGLPTGTYDMTITSTDTNGNTSKPTTIKLAVPAAQMMVYIPIVSK